MLKPITDFANKLYQFDLSDFSFISPIGPWLDQHSIINTIVVIANHLFRAIAMYAFLSYLPYTIPVNCAIILVGSVFYRITIERFCHFRFAIPACLGAVAAEISNPGLYKLIRLSSHQSFQHLACIFARLSPLALYLTAIVWISHSSVQKLAKPKNCCGSAMTSDGVS